tara:strand:+ start:174 stop:782 length:609 start_codon:yes stop_codon:yes gene_type:complete
MTVDDAKKKFNIEVKFLKRISTKSAKQLFNVGYKYCPSCEDIKKIHKFSPKSSGSRLKSGHCISCVMKKRSCRERKDYKGYKDSHREYARKNYLKNKNKVLKLNEEWKGNNPEKYKVIQRKGTAKRRAAKLKASPKWADQSKISLIYKKAYEFSKLLGVRMEVDHVIPLQGKNVCGLHIWENLQLLEKTVNIKKSNHFKGDK